MDEITKLMTEQLRDAYSAEKQALRAMARLQKKASSQSLRDAVQMHIDQTETQVERLEKALEMTGARPGRKVCEGMRGIIEEAQGELEDHDKGPLMDTVIIAGLQRVEHYEIAAYGTMTALAKACGQQELADLLAETLAEEKETDEKLSQLAESEVNPAAIQEGRGGEPANDPTPERRGGKRGAAA
ncbi:YciE/YciF ferroxidase family protein [Siccirubricoccus phaeus]|uniref:YciE/YciF ferroxidase family protein n=1 Tax=Siccirubricoccus phaeus TaxID=2595053 RepID=UPI0011F1D136|nr:ferritin-like domain-containing protein [Siccirubricoccus phaeus]